MDARRPGTDCAPGFSIDVGCDIGYVSLLLFSFLSGPVWGWSVADGTASDDVVFDSLFARCDQTTHERQFHILVSDVFRGGHHITDDASDSWLVGILWISVSVFPSCALYIIKQTTQCDSGQTGRIIVNHEKVRRDSGGKFDDTWSGTLQITSQMEMGEHALTEESKHVRPIKYTPSGKVSGSPPLASVSKASQLSSPSSTCGQKWLCDCPHLDKLQRNPRPRARPVLYLDIPVAKESELSPWSDHASDGAGQMLEDYTKLTGKVLSGECVGDEPQTQDITDAWRDEFADGLSSPGRSPLKLPPSEAFCLRFLHRHDSNEWKG